MEFDKFYFENDSFVQSLKQSYPRYVLALDGIDEILEKLILHPPFSLTQNDFKNQKLVKLLLQAEVIKEKNSFLGLAVPVFIEKDLNALKSLSKKIASQIVSCLVEHQSQLFRIVDKLDPQFTYQRHLYHLLCGKIFDGKMFEFLEDNHLVMTSKILSSGIDCLVIIYEKSALLEKYSSKLLCSFNRYTQNGHGFVSFGDCDGN